MAASKAPKHDFAPAWLKIPEDKNQKPTGSKSSEHKDKNNLHRRKDFPFDYPYGGVLPRQRSFDHYFDERHFQVPKFRQHSLDEDYAYYNGYYNGYPGGAFRPGPANFRDVKYNGRFGHLNGTYPAYCDPYGYDFYPDRFSNAGRLPPGGGRPKSHHKPDKDNHRGGSGGGGGAAKVGAAENSSTPTKQGTAVVVDSAVGDDKDSSINNGTEDTSAIEEEFPSLNGELEPSKEEPTEKSKIPSGVWDKNSRGKILQHNREPDNSPTNKKMDNSSRDIKHSHTHIYKALVPNKGKVVKRNSKDNAKLGSLAKDINSNNSSYSRHNKENNIESPSTPPMDILNTRLVTTPKNLSDKKSDFLKALKQENDLNTVGGGVKLTNAKQELVNGIDSCNTNGSGNLVITTPPPLRQNGGFVNGFEELSLESNSGNESGGGVMLSSSLEAEQRLLREMGWSEDDEENPPITEEEMQEIQQLSKQIKQLKENEQKNGLKRSLPKTWSPQHMPMYSPAAFTQHINSTISSDSESDSDLG